MSYLVLARKWRPQRFEDLIGQDPIVQVLRNSFAQDKLAHAYVFSGPRGVGKTSTARILAKTLNCKGDPASAPCGECPSCKAIADSADIDVIEIDGASNNSVDNIRDLRERVKYAPSGGSFKVYIIDEAHMLSTSAFNALLKTLEEPPPHVIFVMATTEARKIPLTVMSRCQHLPFRRVSSKPIKERLRHIVESEGVKVTEGALSLIARASDGSIRDSLTLLDQVTSFSSDVNEENIKDLLDIADAGALADIATAVLGGEREEIFRHIESLVERGTDLRAFAKDLIRFFRDMLVAKVAASTDGLLELSDEERTAIDSIISDFPEEHLTLVLSEIIKAEADVRTAFSPRVSLEMSLLKVSYLSSFMDINEAISALGGDSQSVAGGQPAPRPKKDNYRISRPIPSGPSASGERKLSIREAPAAPSHEVKAPAAEKKSIKPSPDKEESKSIVTSEAKSSEAKSAEEKTETIEPERKTFFTDETILKALVQRIEDNDPALASKLLKAKASLSPDTLTLTFIDTDAEICAKPFKDNPQMIEKLTTELRALPTKIEIHIKHLEKESTSELKERIKSEPAIMEALDLFDGRIVHVKKLKDQ
ncbi:DNA polymerase III subunit gamma/tau [Nitrospirota bacterium]